MENLVKIAYGAMDEKKATDIKIIDISKVSSIADYFMIASGSNPRQVQAICDNVTELLGRAGINYRSIEGYDAAGWILLDYGDVIIHIFNSADRHFYDLERIWRDGKEVNINS